LKPEAFGNEPALKVIATKLGLNFDKMVYMAEEPNLPPEKQRILGLFDLIAGAVDLDIEVFHKMMEALKVMKPTTAKAAWENHTDYYLRVEVGSDEYMQALPMEAKSLFHDAKPQSGLVSAPNTDAIYRANSLGYGRFSPLIPRNLLGS